MRGRLLPEASVIMAKVGWPEAQRKSEAADNLATGTLLELAGAAVADGAGLIDVARASAGAIESIRAVHPEVIICADADGADLTRDPAIAARTGAALLRTNAPASAGPVPAGTLQKRIAPAGTEPARTAPAGTVPAPRAETVLTEATPAEAIALAAAGSAAVADADGGELAATIATAAVLAWLGVRVVRTRHVAAVRQALEMVESVRGTRTPSWTRRGLA